MDIEIDFDIEHDADQPVYLWGFWGAQWGGVRCTGETWGDRGSPLRRPASGSPHHRRRGWSSPTLGKQVGTLNAAIRDHRLTTGEVVAERSVGTRSGVQMGIGDRVTTRRNDRDVGVARDCWTATGIDDSGALTVRGRSGERTLPASYVREHVELAYATTVHGAQGETVDTAHLLVGESTGAAAAYVGMTRGRHRNVAHLTADTLDEARAQWIDTFSRDRADLGPAHAAQRAGEDIERYGTTAPSHPSALQLAALRAAPQRRPEHAAATRPAPSRGIGR